MKHLPPQFLVPVPLPTPFRPGGPRPLDPLGLHIRDTSDPHKVRDRLVDIGVLRKNGDGTYSPYLPAKADLVNGKVPASQLPEDQQGVTEVLVDGASVVSGGTARIDLSGKVDKEQGKGLTAVQTVKSAGTALVPDAQGAVDIPSASTSAKGVVKLVNGVNSTSAADAATAAAVRMAYNRGTEGINAANTLRGDAALKGVDNEFLGENAFTGPAVRFREAPRVINPGRTGLVFKYWNADASGYWPAFEIVNLSASVWDNVDYVERQFGEFFSDYARGVFEGPEPRCELVSYALTEDVSAYGNSDSFQLLRWDEDAGEEVAWREAYLDFSQAYLDIFNTNSHYDWETDTNYYQLEGLLTVSVCDAGTYELLGTASYTVSWDTSGAFLSFTAYYDDGLSSFYDPETWDWVGAVVDPNSTTFPFTLVASNDPGSSAYDDLYQMYPETYGWVGASDSPVVTLDGVPSAVAPSIIAHNTNSSAHSNISLAASRITSGTFNAARIPSLDAGKITSGTFDSARIPNLPISKVTNLSSELTLTPAYGPTPSYSQWQVATGGFPSYYGPIPSDLSVSSVNYTSGAWHASISGSGLPNNYPLHNLTVVRQAESGDENATALRFSGSVSGRTVQFYIRRSRTDIVSFTLGSQADYLLGAFRRLVINLAGTETNVSVPDGALVKFPYNTTTLSFSVPDNSITFYVATGPAGNVGTRYLYELWPDMIYTNINSDQVMAGVYVLLRISSSSQRLLCFNTNHFID